MKPWCSEAPQHDRFVHRTRVHLGHLSRWHGRKERHPEVKIDYRTRHCYECDQCQPPSISLTQHHQRYGDREPEMVMTNRPYFQQMTNDRTFDERFPASLERVIRRYRQTMVCYLISSSSKTTSTLIWIINKQSQLIYFKRSATWLARQLRHCYSANRSVCLTSLAT